MAFWINANFQSDLSQIDPNSLDVEIRILREMIRQAFTQYSQATDPKAALQILEKLSESFHSLCHAIQADRLLKARSDGAPFEVLEDILNQWEHLDTQF